MQKTCDKCKEDFGVTSDDQSFYDKFGVQVPKLCPTCRSQLRLSFRNERVFYKRACDKCKKDVISMYSPNKSFTVWCYDCWFADDWSGTDFAKDYDSNRPFIQPVSYTHLRAHETGRNLVCRLLLEKKKK